MRARSTIGLGLLLSVCGLGSAQAAVVPVSGWVVHNGTSTVTDGGTNNPTFTPGDNITVQPGDVLITIMGTVGRCAIVPDNIPTAINTKHLCCITLDRSKCVPAFLHAYFLRHPIARRHLAQKAKGAIMEGLNMGIIKEMPIPLAPLALQKKLEARLAEVQEIRRSEQSSAAAFDALFTSMQHRLFRGVL